MEQASWGIDPPDPVRHGQREGAWRTSSPWLLPLATYTARAGSSGQKPLGREAGGSGWKWPTFTKMLSTTVVWLGHGQGGAGKHSVAGTWNSSIRAGTGLMRGWIMASKEALWNRCIWDSLMGEGRHDASPFLSPAPSLSQLTLEGVNSPTPPGCVPQPLQEFPGIPKPPWFRPVSSTRWKHSEARWGHFTNAETGAVIETSLSEKHRCLRAGGREGWGPVKLGWCLNLTWNSSWASVQKIRPESPWRVIAKHPHAESKPEMSPPLLHWPWNCLMRLENSGG